MKLLALDQSSRISGYAIFDDDILMDSGTFVVNEQDLGERLVKVRETIEKLIDENGIDEVAFEDIQLQESAGNNPITFKTLAEVMGVVQELMAERSMPYTIVHSQTWKSTLSIKGKRRAEQKKNAQAFVHNTYNLDVSEDESDAICIGTHIIKEKNSVLNW